MYDGRFSQSVLNLEYLCYLFGVVSIVFGIVLIDLMMIELGKVILADLNKFDKKKKQKG